MESGMSDDALLRWLFRLGQGDWKVKVIAGSVLTAVAIGLCWYTIGQKGHHGAEEAKPAAEFFVFACGALIMGTALVFVGLIDLFGGRRVGKTSDPRTDVLIGGSDPPTWQCCLRCAGAGIERLTLSAGGGVMIRPCEHCHGTGKVFGPSRDVGSRRTR